MPSGACWDAGMVKQNAHEIPTHIISNQELEFEGLREEAMHPAIEDEDIPYVPASQGADVIKYGMSGKCSGCTGINRGCTILRPHSHQRREREASVLIFEEQMRELQDELSEGRTETRHNIVKVSAGHTTKLRQIRAMHEVKTHALLNTLEGGIMTMAFVATIG